MATQQSAGSIFGDRRTAWFVAIISLVLFVAANLPWQVDDYDQAKQAFTSFQMVAEGHWLYQTTPHDRTATKPPLVGWTSAALYLTTRSWELAWRLPSLLSALALAVLLYRWSRSAYGIAGAAIALAAFALNLVTPRLATLVRTDMPLALVIFAIGGMIWQKIRTAEKWGTVDRVFVFLCLTAGMLIKGPVVWAFVIPGIVLFRFWERKPGISAFPGWWPWIGSLAVFLAWVYGGIRFVPNFYEDVVVREFFGRFGGDVHRSQPFFFYLPHLLHKFAPWSLLMIGLGLIEFRAAEWNWRHLKISAPTRWLICWSVGALLVMSILPSKRVDRIFPVIPVLCLLLGVQASTLSARPQYRGALHRWCAVAILAAILISGGYFGWKAAAGYREHRAALAEFGADVRRQAAANQWRYAVVSAPDESLLLYLRKSDFILPKRAAEWWNAGNIDALVVSTRDETELLAQLKTATTTELRSTHREDGDTLDYVLITHTKEGE